MNIREIISYVNQYDKNDEDYLNKIFIEVQNFCEERLKTFKQKWTSKKKLDVQFFFDFFFFGFFWERLKNVLNEGTNERRAP